MSDKYTTQQLKFVELYLELSKDNDNYSEVGRQARSGAGYSDETNVNEILKSVKELILEGQTLRLVQMSGKLLNSLEDVIDNPATPGAKNVIAAASTLLDRGGIIKVEKVNMEVKVPDGVLILPAKQKEKE